MSDPLPEFTVTEHDEDGRPSYSCIGPILIRTPFLFEIEHILEREYPHGFVANWRIGPRRHDLAKQP